MKKTLLSMLGSALMLFSVSCREEVIPTPGFADLTLDTFGITVAPSPRVLGQIMGRPDARFVMVNLPRRCTSG